MGDKSAIEWTDATWNPVTGCDRVSPGCAHCYALELAARLKGMGQRRYQRDGDPKTSGPGFGLTLHPDKLEEPLRWTKPRMVFVNSMSDLFHDEVPDEYIAKVFAVMAVAERHVFQVLTKRPERMAQLLDSSAFKRLVGDQLVEQGYAVPGEGRRIEPVDLSGWPRPNIWLGVTIENRRFVHRADLLRQTPAAVRFISAEPLLGPLIPPMYKSGEALWNAGKRGPGLDLTDIDWLIVGGESGLHHRRMEGAWALDLRDAARDADTAFFFKQWGGATPKSGGRDLDGRTWDEMPS